jgi:hypothetical protein
MIDSDEKQGDKERAAGLPPPPVGTTRLREDYLRPLPAESRWGARRERGYRLSKRRTLVSIRLVRLEAPAV